MCSVSSLKPDKSDNLVYQLQHVATFIARGLAGSVFDFVGFDIQKSWSSLKLNNDDRQTSHRFLTSQQEGWAEQYLCQLNSFVRQISKFSLTLQFMLAKCDNGQKNQCKFGIAESSWTGLPYIFLLNCLLPDLLTGSFLTPKISWQNFFSCVRFHTPASSIEIKRGRFTFGFWWALRFPLRPILSGSLNRGSNYVAQRQIAADSRQESWSFAEYRFKCWRQSWWFDFVNHQPWCWSPSFGFACLGAAKLRFTT